MKKYALLFVCLLLLAAAGVFALQRGANEGVAWDGNLATIHWREDLADPKAAAGEAAFSILTGPYLGWLSPTEATIGWEVIAEKSLTAKPFASVSANYPAEKIKFRSVTLTDLKPDTDYRYRLKSANYLGKEVSFRTFPAAAVPTFKFAMIGDTQRGEVPKSAEVESKLYELIHAWNPTLLVHLGDMMNTGRGDGIGGRKTWYRAFERHRILRGSTFMAPTAGNHCWLGKGHGWYADYFADVKGPKEPDGSRPPFFYSFDVGDIHFVSLCTEAAKVSAKKDVADEKVSDLPFTYNEQLAWFENDLARSRARWKVVFFHKPFHTGGPHPAPTEFRKDFGAVCDKHGVQLVLSGHDHSYQKTKRMTNVARDVSDAGTVQIISGGGDINQFDRVKNPPHWNVYHKKINHYVRAEVMADEMRFNAVDVNGDIFDTWRLPLKGQPEDLPLPK